MERIDCGKEERIQNHRGGEEQLRGTEKQKGVPEKSKSRVTSVMWFPGEGRRNRSLIRRQKKTALLPRSQGSTGIRPRCGL